MNLVEDKKVDIIKDFFALSRWETIVIFFATILVFAAMHICIKKFKMKFQWRVLMGLGLGLLFGIAISWGDGFKGQTEYIGSDGIIHKTFKPSFWTSEIGSWYYMIRSLFVNGLMVMIMPIIFIALAKIVSKQLKTNLSGITWKGILILLMNVVVAFVFTFWLSVVFKVGDGLTLIEDAGSTRDPVKAITSVISGYMPSNFFGVLAASVIIPVLILGALFGYAIKKSTKRHPDAMMSARKALDTGWTLSNSILMVIIKFMPYAIFAMISRAMFSRPIGEFKHIGWIIALAYLCLALAYAWNVFSVWLVGIKPMRYMKLSFPALLNGFVTQSSVATMPMAIEILNDKMKVKNAPNIVMPLSTTMGLMGCAGVQSGVILSLLYNSGVNVGMPLITYFLLGVIVTVIASLGIAGIPGTATIVTIGVVSAMGLPGFVNPVIDVISPLNGIFDMGRTAVNVNAGMTTSLIASQLEGEMPKDMQSNSSPLGRILNTRNNRKANPKSEIIENNTTMQNKENKEIK